MSIYTTNGYILQCLISAAEDVHNKDHAEANDYIVRFRAMELHFFNYVHPFVDVGLAISETQLAGGATPNIFTVHGSKHISDLINVWTNLQRLSPLTKNIMRLLY